MFPNSHTEQLLSLSTCHVPQAELSVLNDAIRHRAANGIVRDTATLLIVDEQVPHLPQDKVPFLIDLALLASRTGHTWLNLDRDVPPLLTLPQFDWENPRSHDNVTLAYLALGASQAKEFSQAVDALEEGELGFIGRVTEFAPILDMAWRVLDKTDVSYEGVFAYDIAEPVGRWLVKQYLIRDEFPRPFLVYQHALSLMGVNERMAEGF
ncbi:hypothetical protein PJK54_11780 [Cobetia sp. MMG027]|uniref:DUF5983 family protein n=1 Tax=Cobetia sp. MMG027 TaxID=3021980 RepID=UPI0022FEF03A|nr:hypothetical protein [Cobetia sp. MMG027]MDA5564343.1 hypothetical protein [Cobetia sp. MMG027]